MKKNFAIRLAGVLCLGGLLLGGVSGCGSSNNEFVVTPGAAAPVASTEYLLGRVLLDGPVSNVPVEIRDTTGQVLHRFTTNSRGWFQKRGTVPADFTVVALVGSNSYRREVRGGWSRGTLYVSTGTTLLSAYAAAHPELSLESAQERLRQALQLAPGFKLSWVGQVQAPNFSEAGFLQGVQQFGGLQAYLEARVQEIDSVRGAEVIDRILKQAKGLAGDAVNAIWGSTVSTAVGDAIANCGFNYTTASALNSISAQLSDVEDDIEQLEGELQGVYQEAQLQDDLDDLAAAGDTLGVAINDLQQTVDAYRASHTNDGSYNVPQEANQTVVTARSNLLNFNIENTAQPLTTLADGTIQAEFFRARATSGAQYFPDKDQWLSYPWRQNSVTREAQNLLAQNWARLEQATYLMSEAANASDPSERATQLNVAYQQSQVWAADMQRGNFYVPDPVMADDVLYDAATGTLWANEFFEAVEHGDANDAVAQLTYGPVGETVAFSLPTHQEVERLCQNRAGVQISDIRDQMSDGEWDDADTDDWVDAFQTLGFDTTYYDNIDNAGIGGSDDNEGSWVQSWSTSDNKYNFVTWNNDGDNPDDDNYTDNETCSYLARVSIYDTPDQASQTDGDPAQVALATVSALSPWSPGMSMNTPVLTSGQTTTYGGVQIHAGLVFQKDSISGGNYNNGTSYDVTNRLEWSSSDSRVASVSNLASETVPAPAPTQLVSSDGGPGGGPAPAGFLIWHPPVLSSDPALAPVTVTARAQMVSPYGYHYEVVGNLQVNPPSGLTPVVKSVNFIPRNTQYEVTASDPPLINFYVTAFFQDGRAIDMSTDANTTWELLDDNGNLIFDSTQGGFGQAGGSFKNQLILRSGITTFTPTVRVTYDSPFGRVTDQGKIAVVIKT